MTGFGSTATRHGRPSTAPLRWVTTAGSSRCATRRTRRTCSPRTRSGRCLRGKGITEENVKILGFACYSHHVRFADRWRVGRVFLAGDAAHAMPPWIGQGMCAGVRDVANLCWKLGAVLSGSLPESVLDTYQAERLPHVKEVTNRAVKTGKLIIQRNPLARGGTQPLLPHRQQGARVHRLAASTPLAARCALPQGSAGAQRKRRRRLADPTTVGGRREGRLGAPRRRRRRSLDGAAHRPGNGLPGLANRWRPHPENHAAAQCSERRLHRRQRRIADPLAGEEGRDSVVVVRPDGFVYAAAKQDQPLPPPPAGFKS